MIINIIICYFIVIIDYYNLSQKYARAYLNYIIINYHVQPLSL